MLTTLGPENRIWFCLRPTSLTRSFDGLSALVHNHLRSDPTNGDWYVFVNRRRTMMKILSFDRDGYWIWSNVRQGGQRVQAAFRTGACEHSSASLSHDLECGVGVAHGQHAATLAGSAGPGPATGASPCRETSASRCCPACATRAAT